MGSAHSVPQHPEIIHRPRPAGADAYNHHTYTSSYSYTYTCTDIYTSRANTYTHFRPRT